MSKPLTSAQPLLPPRPEQGRSMLIVLAVMALLAALSLLFARGADRLDTRWTAQLNQSATAQVLVGSEALRDAQMERAEAVLREWLPGAKISALSPADARELLDPWLGDTVLPDDLPVPGLIEIRAKDDLPVLQLGDAFTEAGLRVILDDHSRFSADLQRTVGRVVWLGLVLIGLTVLAAFSVSTFATRAGLAAQHDIIHVLVQAGASDSFIARLFIVRSAWHGLVGGLIGALIAAAGWAVLSFGPAQGTVGWRGLADSLLDIGALAALTGLFGLICAGAACVAALRQLARERRRA